MVNFKTTAVHSWAWIIEGEQSVDQIEGSMQTPGQQQDHSSFWSKAASIYSALLMVWYFLQEHLTTGEITVACDGRSVLDQLQSKNQSINLQHMWIYFGPARVYSYN